MYRNLVYPKIGRKCRSGKTSVFSETWSPFHLNLVSIPLKRSVPNFWYDFHTPSYSLDYLYQMPPAPKHPLIGTVIDNGRLYIDSILGSGGFGVVFRATDTTTGHNYALKCLPRAPRGSPSYLRHKAELTLHQRVNGHSNIVALHRVIDDRGSPYIMFLFDLFTGGDLFQPIVDRRCIGDDALLRHVFGQMLEAVAHCHAKNVFHRDIKPENFLCTPDLSSIALADFGLATDEQLADDFRLGSPVYMSPGKQTKYGSYRFSLTSLCRMYALRRKASLSNARKRYLGAWNTALLSSHRTCTLASRCFDRRKFLSLRTLAVSPVHTSCIYTRGRQRTCTGSPRRKSLFSHHDRGVSQTLSCY
jgi:hypothetical protein